MLAGDHNLIEGDRMYLNALENQSIPNTETLPQNYLPNQAHWTVESPIEVTNKIAVKLDLTQ